jgi:rifampicin phosphotransferase
VSDASSVLPGTAALGADPASVGGKALNLARMAVAGADVPPWIVIRASAADPAGPSDALLDEVMLGLRRLGLDQALLAVRSSAAGEDAGDASFAGQFETVLGVHARDRESLREAIGRVWGSVAREHVRAYQSAAGATSLGPEPPPMAVVVQALVPAEAAGVCFSADPVTGERDVAVVSAVRGLGEALVSGAEDGDSFRVRFTADPRSSAADREVGEEAEEGEVTEARVTRQRRQLRRTEGGTEWLDLDEADGVGAAISEVEAVEIARVTRRLAVALGGPQDVEWALVRDEPGGASEGRRLVLLQARPITTLPSGRRRIWDNSNIVESYAGVTTPLTFSFARSVYEDVYRQFCQVMGVSTKLVDRNRDLFAHMLGLVRGRVYYNLLNWYRLLSLLPGYSFNRPFMERMMGVRQKLADPPEPQLVTGKWRDLGRLVRSVLGMVHAHVRLPREVRAFHRRLDDALLPLAAVDLESWDADDLLALYHRLEDDLLRHWQPPLVNDFFAMIWFGVLGRLVERWLPAEPPTLVNDLLSGEGGMISTEPARRVMALAGRVATSGELEALFRRYPDDGALLRALETAEGDGAGLREELGDYLRRFGDRCANELKLETVPMSEDPTFLIATVRSYWRQGAVDPGGTREREWEIRTGAEERVRQQLGGVRRHLFHTVLGQTRARIRDRENLRFERTRVFAVVRRIFLGFGHALVRAGRLDEPRDVFWLTIEEVFGWADGTGVSTDFRPLVEARRAEFDDYAAGPPPPERFETVGPPAEATLVPAPSPAGPDGEPGRLAGIGCCPGVVRAPVRIVHDPRAAGDLGGMILVAERTDPGWTLLFPSAAGILVERGSLLSHSAIVAREMGIPCVVSVPGLLATLVDGELVEMDGSSGVVRRGLE